MVKDQYYGLKEEITETEIFQILKEIKRRRWSYTISTELDNMSFRDADHDDIDLRDEFSEIQASNDMYKIVGFIVLENIKIDNLTIFDGENSITFFVSSHANIIHFTGSKDELKELISKLSLNPEYWVKEVIKPDP